MKLKLSLVVLAALLVVPVALANSIDYPTGTFMSGTLSGSFTNGGTLDVNIVGSLNTIDIKTGTLTQFTAGCPASSMCFSFSSGMVTVDGGSVFSDTLSGGLTINNQGGGSIQATLTNQKGISSGDATATFTFEDMKISDGSEDLSFNRSTVPEPSTLMLLGGGLVGIIAFRNKFTLKGGS